MIISLFVMWILSVMSMALSNSIVDEQWKIWKQAYGKSYRDVEEDRARREIWLENLEKIAAHNAQYHQGNSTYEMAMNEFGDLTSTEFVELFTDSAMYEMANYTDDALSDIELEELEEIEEVSRIPKEVDWRQMGYVRDVKNQGSCLSCYAFAAAGALEGQLAKKRNQYVDLSVQNIIDCSNEFKNYGCNGGLPYRAFKYIKKYGIETDQSYPYQAKRNDRCFFNSFKSVTTIKEFKRIKNIGEKKLAALVARVGPVSVLVYSSLNSWRFYKSGIFDDVDCNKRVDHAVVLVGYVGVSSRGYWIIKNSWGKSWGEEGYMRMIKGKNMCGIKYCVSYPTI
ncbi:procathepsin L-like [Stegostoma tigrinum]|uniref:procathepsin L-like n=1 Tax=Stegostoma tigrinum TaxID=3053191 RepID=UPI00202AE013|nr:procathepsin L-like [Stegostoma tigrinum]